MVPGDVVLDLGAHVGYFTSRAADAVGPEGKVYAFEPHPNNFANLFANCNHLKNVELVQAAAWNFNKTVQLYPMDGNSGGHSLFPFDGHLPVIEVTAIDLSFWLLLNDIHPTFVKIDAESSEERILESLLRTEMRPALAIEIHTERLYRDCRTLLLSKGYAVIPDTPVCRRTLMYAMMPDDIGIL